MNTTMLILIIAVGLGILFINYSAIHGIVFYFKNKEEIEKRYWGKNKVHIEETIWRLAVYDIGMSFIMWLIIGELVK